jgi:hypothetical protein
VTVRPPLLAAATLTVDSRLTLSFPPFSGSVDLPLPRKPASLDVFMGIDPVEHKEHVAEVRLWPDATGKRYSLSVDAMLSPVEGTSRGHALAWKNVGQGSPPFDNVAAVEGQFNVIKRPVTVAPGGSRQEEAHYYTTCRARTDAKDVDIRAICSRFQEGIRVSASPSP